MVSESNGKTQDKTYFCVEGCRRETPHECISASYKVDSEIVCRYKCRECGNVRMVFVPVIREGGLEGRVRRRMF